MSFKAYHFTRDRMFKTIGFRNVEGSILKKLTILSSLLIFLTSQGSAAMTIEKLSTISSRFERTLNLKIYPNKERKIETIIYGNDEVGFFKSRNWQYRKNWLKIKILPPSYHAVLDIFALYTGGKVELLTRKKFKSPLPVMFKKMQIDIKNGSLSNQFYLLNGALPRRVLFNANFETKDPNFYKKNINRFTYLMIINKRGEVVWVHVPIIDGALFGSYISAKRIGNGFYGMMFGRHSGYFEVAKYNGDVMRSFSSRDSKVPFAMHHDFEMIGANKLYAVGNKTLNLRSYTGKSVDKDKTFITDTIIGINLAAGNHIELRDFISEFNPQKTPYFTGDKLEDKKFTLWGRSKADIDFLHINGLRYVKGEGVLVSLRNISKVVLLDSKFQKIKWTLGSERSDTFFIREKSDRFLQQHTPTLISDDELLLFDNAAKTMRSRVIKYKMNRNNGLAKKTWVYYPSTRLYSKDRSSVYQLPNGSYGVYFVNPYVNGSKTSRIPHRDVYYEVNPQNGRETAEVHFTFGVSSPGYRMMPIPTIGSDEFVGFKTPFSISKKNSLRTQEVR